MKYKSASEGSFLQKKDYAKKILFSLNDFQQKGHQLQIVTIPPHTKQRMHSHNKQTEVFYILEGYCIITINNQDFDAKVGDSFICEPGDTHNLWNKSAAEFKLVVFKINLPENSDDTNWVESDTISS